MPGLERSVQRATCHRANPCKKIDRNRLQTETMDGRGSNLSIGAGEALPSQDFPMPTTPKRRRLESQRDQLGRERQEVIAIQRETLAAVSAWPTPRPSLLGVAKRWMTFEEHKTFNGGQSYQGSEPNY